MRTAAAWLLAALLAGCAGGPPESSRFDGSFIQLLRAHGTWRDAEWDALFDCLAANGAREIVVQWSVIDEVAFAPIPGYRETVRPPLENLFARADARGMKVWLGLVHDTGYWRALRGDTQARARYLAALRERERVAANALAPLAGRHASFAGWYLSEELDPASWSSEAERATLAAHLGAAARELKRLTPTARVAVSGFANSENSPEATRAFWAALFDAAPALDVLMFQDGVGAGKLDLAQAAARTRSLAELARSRGRELVLIVETFEAGSAESSSRDASAAFVARPAAPERIAAQIDSATQAHVRRIAFSLPEYQCAASAPAGKASAR